jgi:hypothetical protein
MIKTGFSFREILLPDSTLRHEAALTSREGNS